MLKDFDESFYLIGHKKKIPHIFYLNWYSIEKSTKSAKKKYSCASMLYLGRSHFCTQIILLKTSFSNATNGDGVVKNIKRNPNQRTFKLTRT